MTISVGGVLAERFLIRRRLGAGGMGEVFEAQDQDRGERIALKTLTRAGGDVLARFKREFRALQTTAHPNLVSLRDLVRDGENWFFTMELIEGKHFLEHCKSDVDKLRAAMRQLAAGLRALHDAGLVHRDVKPSNVMVTDDGRVVLLDFGLVTDQDPAQQSIEGHAVGTVEYMAPEQAVGRRVSEAADWYAVGVMLFEALTGQVPHTGHVLQILVDKQQVEARAIRDLAPDAPADLCLLARDLLQIEPAARPRGDEVAKRLGAEERELRTTSTLHPSLHAIFVGRERELAELAAALERSRDRPVVHLVVGESGIGKSELVARFCDALDEQALVLHGRCYERESVPFKAIDGVADGLASHLSRLAPADVAALLPSRPSLLIRLFPVFQRIESIASAAAPRHEGEPHEHRRQMFAALRHLLLALATAHTVIITIDDLQWADADSFLLLRELLRGGGPKLLVIATVRGDAAQADAVVDRLAGLQVHRTTLGPLSEDESRVLAEKLVPGVAARLDLARVAREAGGHPMFLHEILRHLEGVGGDGAATLDDALWARVGLLRAEARAVLEAVCVADAPIPIDVAARACKLDPTVVGRAAATLRVASLAREVQRGRGLALEPYHDRVREAVQGRLGAETLRDLHARLAGALEASSEPRDAQLLLRHFMLADMPERAARYAEEAAQRSLDAGAFDQAAEVWKVALDLVARDEADRRRILLRLGEALVHAGRGAEAAEHYLAAAEGADRPTRLECHRHATEQLLISGRIARGIAALDALLAEIDVSVPKTPRRALISVLANRAVLRLRGLGFKERHKSEIADAEFLKLDVFKIAAYGLAMVDSIHGMDFQTRALRQALRTGSRERVAHALLYESMFQSTNTHLARAEQLLTRALEVAGPSPGTYVEAVIASARGMISYFGGRIEESLTRLAEADALIRRVPGNKWEQASIRLFTLFALRFVGDYTAMRVLHDQYSADAQQRGDRYLDSTMRRVCVPMWLAADDPTEGELELARATWVPETTGYHVQHFHELVARGEIALYRGEPADSARLAQGFERLQRSMLLRVGSIRTQYAYLRGRLALAGEGSLRDAERAAKRLAGEQSKVAQVWGILLGAGIAAASGRTDDACTELERAATAATLAGMRLSSAAARRRLAELRGDDDLAIAAAADMAPLGVRAPVRMTALLIPFR